MLNLVEEIETRLRAAARGAGRRPAETFTELIELMAISMRNRIPHSMWEESERRYLDILGQYPHGSGTAFSEALGCLSLEMQNNPRDVLGEIFMRLEAGDRSTGQHFTPDPLSDVMAGILVDGAREIVRERGYVTVYEPCSGAGSTIIAAVKHLRAQGVNTSSELHVTAEDVSQAAVHMSYVQLSLLHVPAMVVCRDTLSGEVVGTPWVTAEHTAGGWQ